MIFDSQTRQVDVYRHMIDITLNTFDLKKKNCFGIRTLYGDDDVKDSLGIYMSEHVMKEIDFNLCLCWCDFVTGVEQARSIKISHGESKMEWDKSLNYFTLVRRNGVTQEDLITESMTDSLHKCMVIACTHYLVCEIETSCPGWSWLLMEVDKHYLSVVLQ
jgi:hypothetical protein